MRDRFNASEWLLDRRVEAGDDDRVAIRCQGVTTTYGELLTHVENAAASLRALGLRPEERVALAVLDSVEFVAVFLGAMRIGAVPLPMNPLLPGRDLGVIVADSRARLLVISAARAEALDDLLSGAPEVESVVIATHGAFDAERAPFETTAPLVGWEQFVGLAVGGDGSAFPTWAESPGFWLCTSGSTGRPKLAMHRHGDLVFTNEAFGQGVLRIGPDDRCYSVGPMFHAYGLGNSLTFPLAAGAVSILDPTRPPTPTHVGALVATEAPTMFFCLPTFYAALIASTLPDDTFRSVRFGVSAAEALPAETFNRFVERFGVTILDGIGSTEMLHIYLSNQPGRVRAGTSGTPVPGYEIRLVDDLGNDQAPGVPGQLVVRGESAAVGYWCRSDTSRSTFRGEWMFTGDLYDRDPDGFYAYLGRVDDMLRVGGEWVSPAEVEGVLIEHAQVLEAALVGYRDDQGIVRPVAHVVPIEGAGGAELEAALTDHCRARLAGYKRPRRYVIVEELPKTATGKIQRFKLRE